MAEPWQIKPLDEWSIVGMNHYHVNGQKYLFVAMTKDGYCITEEGADDQYLWNRLCHKASDTEKRQQQPKPLGLSDQQVMNNTGVKVTTTNPQETELKPIYVASRASIPERGAMWRKLRDEGVRITSSWIDEDSEGATADFGDLWVRIVNEIRAASALVLYAEVADFPLKGALMEAGIALGMGKPVFVCLPALGVLPRNYRPIGSWIAHPLVTRCDSIKKAVWLATRVRDSTAATVDADIANSAANKIADYFNAPPSVVPAIEQIINRCVSASPVALRDEPRARAIFDTGFAASSSPPPRELAQAAAEEIWKRIDSEKHLTLPNQFEIAAIIERCLAAGK